MCTANAATALQAGGVIQGVAGFAKAQADATTLEFQSKIAGSEAALDKIRAEDARTRGAVEAVQLRQGVSKSVAASVAQTAGSGIDIGGATAQEVFLSTEGVGIADVLESQRNTRKSVWAFETSAALKKSQAKQLKKAAKRTRLLAPITFAAPVIKGFGQAKLATTTGGKS